MVNENVLIRVQPNVYRFCVDSPSIGIMLCSENAGPIN